MKHQNSLFLLIKSLNKNEKGYFKKFSGRYSPDKANSYLKLFDFIDNQEEFDDNAIKEKFSKEKFSKNLSVTKAYLYDSILKTLRLYNSEKNVFYVIKNNLMDINLLFKKSLYEQCRELLSKTEELAKKYEDYPSLLEIYSLEFKLLIRRLSTIKDPKRKIAEYYQNTQDLIKKITEHNQFKELSLQLYYSLGNKIYDESANFFAHHPLISGSYSPLSFRAYALYYNLRSVIALHYEDSEKKSLEINTRYVAFLEEHQHFIKEDPDLYKTALTNLMSDQLMAGYFDEYKKSIQKYQLIPAIEENDKIISVEQLYMLELSYFLVSKQFFEGLAFITKGESILKKHTVKMNKAFLLAIYDSMSVIYFITGDYSKALLYTNKIIHEPYEESVDVKAFAQVFYLLIHFELNNYDHVEYKLKFVKEFLQKYSGNNKELVEIFGLMKKITTYPDKHLVKEEMLRTKNTLESIRIKNPLSNGDCFFDFCIWLDSKIKNIPYPVAASPEAHK